MKTLKESLFDTNLATKDLPREAILNQVFKNIKELADALTVYFKGELKTPIKILKSRAVFRNPITGTPYVVSDHFTLTFERYQKEIRFGISSTSKKLLLMQCTFFSFEGGRVRGNILGERSKPYEFGKDNFFEWFTNQDSKFIKLPMWQVFGLKDKIKENLQESLFDKDLASKEFCMNDLYNIECWPARPEDDWRNAEKTFSICYGDGVNPKNNTLYRTMLNPPFNKITKNAEGDWADIKHYKSPEYDFDFNLYLITWFIMGCHDEKEIKRKLRELLIKANRVDDVVEYGNDVWDWSLIDCAIDIFHETRSDNIRMIVLKLYTNNPQNSSTIYMTLTKKID